MRFVPQSSSLRPGCWRPELPALFLQALQSGCCPQRHFFTGLRAFTWASLSPSMGLKMMLREDDNAVAADDGD